MNYKYCDVGSILLSGSTDKNTTHKYGTSYELIFNSQYLQLERPLRVLEIGVSLFGEGSVGPLSEIPYVEKYVGLDNKKYNGKIPNEKVTLYTGTEYDAYTSEMIKFLNENEAKFDIIIDDGPHTWETQEWFFVNYYSLLNEGGVLICEDIFEGNYGLLEKLQKRLDLYVLDLRVNSNKNKDEIIALRFKKKMDKKNALIIPVYNSLLEDIEYNSCIKTWEYFCKKYGIELHLLNGTKGRSSNSLDIQTKCCYDRWFDHNLDLSEYNRITFVDADTIVRWDAYDFNKLFDENGIEIGVVEDQGGPGVGIYHFNQWLSFKPNLYSFVRGYFNAGFVSMKSEHLIEIQKKFIEYKNYYFNEKDIKEPYNEIGKENGVRIDAMDQTAINLCIQELFSEKITFLPKSYNLQLSYYYGWPQTGDYFFNQCKNLDFVKQAGIFHLGGLVLSKVNLASYYLQKMENKYKI